VKCFGRIPGKQEVTAILGAGVTRITGKLRLTDNLSEASAQRGMIIVHEIEKFFPDTWTESRTPKLR
jgi:hypothetical protein